MSFSKPLNIRGLRIPGDLSSGRADGRPLGSSAYPMISFGALSSNENKNTESSTKSDPIVVDDDETPPPARNAVRNILPQYSSSPPGSDDQSAGDAEFLPSSMPDTTSVSNEDFHTSPLGVLSNQRPPVANLDRYTYPTIVPETTPHLVYADTVPHSSSDPVHGDHQTFLYRSDLIYRAFEGVPEASFTHGYIASNAKESITMQHDSKPPKTSEISRLVQDNTAQSGVKRRREDISDDEENLTGGVKLLSQDNHVEIAREKGKHGCRIDAGINEQNILLPSVKRSATVAAVAKDRASRSQRRSVYMWKLPAKSKARSSKRQKQKKESDIDTESLDDVPSSSPQVLTSDRSSKKSVNSARRDTLANENDLQDSQEIIKTLRSDLAAKDKSLKTARKKNADLTKAAKDGYANLVDTRRKLHLMMEGTKNWMEASKNMLKGVEGGPNGAQWGMQLAGAVNFALLEQVREMPELKPFSVAALEASKVIMEEGGVDGMARHIGGFFVGDLSAERSSLGKEDMHEEW